MTDKELINNEIERRINNLWHLLPEGERVLQDNFTKDDANNLGKYTELESLLRFIDSLPEESKCIYNRTLDERKKFCKYCSAACDVRIEEELVNEDLEEEIDNYIKDNFFGSGSIGFFSNRTKQELNSIDVANIAHHFAEWQKQQMMKDAVDGEVVYQIGSSILAPTDIRYKVVSDRVYIPNVKLGDKVKIIIVKEEQQ